MEIKKAGGVSTADALVAAAGGAQPVRKKKAAGSGKIASAEGKTVELVSTQTAPTEVKGEVVKGAETVKAADAPKKETKTDEQLVAEVKEKASVKQIAAKKIFDREMAKKPAPAAGDVAGVMAKEMKITYSNAYYYVTRVFHLKSAKAK